MSDQQDRQDKRKRRPAKKPEPQYGPGQIRGPRTKKDKQNKEPIEQASDKKEGLTVQSSAAQNNEDGDVADNPELNEAPGYIVLPPNSQKTIDWLYRTAQKSRRLEEKLAEEYETYLRQKKAYQEARAASRDALFLVDRPPQTQKPIQEVPKEIEIEEEEAKEDEAEEDEDKEEGNQTRSVKRIKHAGAIRKHSRDNNPGPTNK